MSTKIDDWLDVLRDRKSIVVPRSARLTHPKLYPCLDVFFYSCKMVTDVETKRETRSPQSCFSLS